MSTSGFIVASKSHASYLMKWTKLSLLGIPDNCPDHAMYETHTDDTRPTAASAALRLITYRRPIVGCSDGP